MADFCVCAEPIQERGLYPCGHALCLSCTLKKRTLMKDTQCPYCRTPAKQVAVVADGATEASAAHIDFPPGQLKVQTKELVKELRHILEYPCPVCAQTQKNYKTLKSHVQNEHHKVVCDVCTKHEYIFSDEYLLFDPRKIKEHLKKRHVFCKYCRQYFYNSAEFSKHCKQMHMGCAICERRDPEHPLYFRTYDQLYEHYKEKHYMCMVPSCLENKHIVFGTALELNRHMMETHKGLPAGSKQAQQQVDIRQVNQDAEEAQASTAQGPSRNEIESDKMRYEARLEIAANHSKEKIDKLHAASETFLKKRVPVEVFVATYEGILTDSAPGMITALLSAFTKAHRASLPAESLRALEFKLNRRTHAEEEAEHKKESAQKGPSAVESDAAKPRTPAAAPAPRINWGYNVGAASGIGNLATLPSLGKSTEQTVNRHVVTSNSSPALGWSSHKSRAPVSAMQNLPTLTKRSSASLNGQAAPPNTRQTSIPLRDSRGGAQSSFFQSLHSNPESRSASPSPSPSLSPSLSAAALPTPGAAASSSASSLHTRPKPQPQPQSREGLHMGSLPQLPQRQQADKKRQRNVLRIV